MEQIHTQVLLNGQFIGCLFTRQKVKRRPIDHLMKLACVFVPYKPPILVHMYNKYT